MAQAHGGPTAQSPTETVTPAPDNHVAQLFGRDSLYMLMWTVQIVCAAALTPIITRVLGLSAFGTVTSANAVMQVLFVFAGLGLQTAVQREYSARANPRGARQLVMVAVVFIVVISALAWYTVGLWGSALQMEGDAPALRLAVLWAGSSAMTTVSLALLRSHDKLAYFSLVSLVQSVVAEALALGMVAFYRPTAEVFLTGQVAAQFLAALLGLALAPPALFLLRDKAVLSRALLFALPLVPSALSSFVLSTSDRLIIEADLGSEAVARYQVAYNIGSMPMLLLWILHSAWMPRFFGITNDAERRTVLAESRDALYRLLIPVLIGFACGAPLVLRVWAPASYQPDRLLLLVCIVLITAIPSAGQLAVTRALTADGRTGVTAVVTVLAAALNVALNVVLVPRLALTGSALATLAAYAFLHIALSIAGGNSLKVPRPARLLQLQLAGVAVFALLSAGLADTPFTLTIRAIAVAGTAAWFLRMFVRIGKASQNAPRPAGH
jgi:O-antigen/teichoic acid export membrane protein